MIKKLLTLNMCMLVLHVTAQTYSADDISRWKQTAQNVTIIRDNWGIPHVYGKTDADAVFGLLYAQCEDDFSRVEMNYIDKLGRLSEVYGEKDLYQDVYTRLVIDSADAVHDYENSPAWLKSLLDAFADGINYFLYTHKNAHPLLLQYFKPWYALMWTDGSIGAISTGNITSRDVEALYTNTDAPVTTFADVMKENTDGSNGFAVSPFKTADGHAILYINPHVIFYFRPEVHMISQQGLDAYGAVTWGQFFIYQGFNEHCGWMHTSSDVDVSDMYAEDIISKNGKLYYRFDDSLHEVQQKQMHFYIKEKDGVTERTITAYYTHHGPVMAKRNGKYISVRCNNRSMDGLVQSWERSKTTGLKDFEKVMEIRGNTSNNTVFADDKGNIAYWHGDFVPKRDTQYNWSQVQDGTTSATDWKGLHTINEIVHIINPKTGFIQNCNSTPFTVSGNSSPEKKDYPKYMAPDGENFRALNAAALLAKGRGYTLDKMIAAGYNRHLTAFEILMPALVKAYKDNGNNYPGIKDAMHLLSSWDYNVDTGSVATTLAVTWAERLSPSIARVYIDEGEMDQVQATKYFASHATADQLLQALQGALDFLQQRFGSWNIAWGNINRYQRISDDIRNVYDETKPSFAVPFVSSTWGMIPAYNSRYNNVNKYRYGVSGNSFICAVEFGKTIKAKSLLAGGDSGDPSSPHFFDEGKMYAEGKFKDVLFYKKDVLKHAEKTYHPGEE